jgi:hypothetical protein
MRFVATLAALALTACATTTGVYKAGPDTLGVTTSASMGRGGLSAARESAYEQAGAACAGAAVQTVSERPQAIVPTDGMAHFDLHFTCQRPA